MVRMSTKVVYLLALVLVTGIGAICARVTPAEETQEATEMLLQSDDVAAFTTGHERQLKQRAQGTSFFGVDKVERDESRIATEALDNILDVGGNPRAQFRVCATGCFLGGQGDPNFPEESGSINGCTDPSCFCQATGLLGVQPNPFDDKCSTFINCPSTVAQPCAPGTLFNTENSVCDFPNRVDCIAVQF